MTAQPNEKVPRNTEPSSQNGMCNKITNKYGHYNIIQQTWRAEHDTSPARGHTASQKYQDKKNHPNNVPDPNTPQEYTNTRKNHQQTPSPDIGNPPPNDSNEEIPVNVYVRKVV